MNNEIIKRENCDFEVKKTAKEINGECMKIIKSFQNKYGSRDIFFANFLNQDKYYFSKKKNEKLNFTTKDLEKLQILLLNIN